MNVGDRRFDLVMSLYVVEHLVWPHRLLDQMHRLARPGGLVAILTPPFREHGYLKSFHYGLSATPFAAKIRRFKFLDALLHLYQHRIVYPRLLRRRYRRGQDDSRFLIHLNPVSLTGVEFFSDSDAVYLSDTREMSAYLASLGAREVAHWPEWGYLLMRTAGGSADDPEANVPVHSPA